MNQADRNYQAFNSMWDDVSGRTYHVRIDGQWMVQDRMFTRADMAFWGFTLADVRPPTGYVVSLGAHGEPTFTV